MKDNTIISQHYKIIICFVAQRKRKIFQDAGVLTYFQDSITPALREQGCEGINVLPIPTAKYAVLVELSVPIGFSGKKLEWLVKLIKKTSGEALTEHFAELAKMRYVWAPKTWSCIGDMDDAKWRELLEFLEQDRQRLSLQKKTGGTIINEQTLS